MGKGPDRVELKDDGTCVPANLREPITARNFSKLRLWQLWQLQGGHPQECIENAVHIDATDKRFVQSFALGDVVNMRRLVTREGPPTVTKLVGWLRARIEETFDDEPAFALLAESHVDMAVDREPVEDFLLECVMARCTRNRKRIAGLKAFVPSDDPQAAVHYLRKGFRESPSDPEEFVWTTR